MTYSEFYKEVNSKTNNAELTYIGKFGDKFEAMTKSGKKIIFDIKSSTWAEIGHIKT